MIAAALFLAATLSSPQIGKFFTLPAWMPKSVASENTPGSSGYDGNHRIVSNELAAVNAIFEAFCERAYYSQAGTSNNWNEATYGPRCNGSDKRSFWFWTKYPVDYPNKWWYMPSNQVVTTRRFREYDNLDSLASRFMLGASASDNTFNDFINLNRPGGWHETYKVQWASSAFANAFPTVNWGTPSALLSSVGGGWRTVAKTWSQVAADTNATVNIFNDNEYNFSGDTIPFFVVSDLDYGEPEMTDAAIAEHIDRTYAVGTAAYVLGNEVYGITNASRRLVTDRVAGLGAILSGLDVTYALVSPQYPYVVSNYLASASRSYSATTTCATPTWNVTADGWSASVSRFDIPSMSFVGQTVSNQLVDASEWSETHKVRFMSQAIHAFTTDAMVAGTNGTAEIRSDPQSLLAAFQCDPATHAEIEPGNDYTIWFNTHLPTSTGMKIYVDIRQGIGGSIVKSVSGDFPVEFASGMSVTALATSSTQYYHGFSFGDPMWSPYTDVYPGDYTMCGDVKLWTVASIGRLVGTSSSRIRITGWPSDMVVSYGSAATNRNFKSLYHSQADTTLSAALQRAAVFNFHEDIDQKLAAELYDACPASPFSPAAVLGVVAAGLDDSSTLANMEMPAATVNAGLKLQFCSALTIENAGKTIYFKFTIDENGTAGDFKIGIVTADGLDIEEVDAGEYVRLATIGYTIDANPQPKSGHSPINHDFYGASVNGKIRHVSRVKWNWNALRRE